ncbi:hypothetical protein LCGC14_1003010 [marine sediment metagenome]|uniref:Uncharacterized protein n=1 Tax=marine sediment metagenome TaxID=412755 RepID=A0A0F9QKU8_9ZZZZ
MAVHDEACEQCGEFLAYANAKSLPEVVNRLDSLTYREHTGRHALEQAQAENKRLVADLEEQTLLTEQVQARGKLLKEIIEGFLLYLNDSPDQTIIPDGRISDAAAVLAEGDEDGELKPEAERRLKESLKTPREKLLTSDEMRQKLEDADDDPD